MIKKIIGWSILLIIFNALILICGISAGCWWIVYAMLVIFLLLIVLIKSAIFLIEY
jgi:hypothetical protein